MKVLVCGGRDYTDAERVATVLDELLVNAPAPVIIHGGARGADQQANDWARERKIVTLVFRADWDLHGKSAGPIRNRQMLTQGKPDLVVAFPGSKGTENMIRQAQTAGVPVHLIPES